MKIKVRALQNFPYDYADRKIGDVFECEPDHARVFNFSGKTKMYDEKDKKEAPPKYETSAVKAEERDDKPQEGRRNKRYMRRDMRPQE